MPGLRCGVSPTFEKYLAATWRVAGSALLALGLLTCAGRQAFAQHSRPTPARDSSLTASVSRALHDVAVPGTVWAIVRGDSTQLGAAGIRDVATRTPMTVDTRVQLGSVTKTLLATGVLMLVTRGQLALDEPVASYLPNLPIANPWQASAPITVRHLLDHTSGLGDAHLWQVFSTQTSPDLPLRDAIARAGATLRVQSRPGTRFSYSNTGYTLLGLLIEAVAGERYEAYLDRELLAPLGMSHSSFAWQSQVGQMADMTMAMGHFDDGTRQPSYGLATRPAAQFATTAGDMARFARFLMSDGRVLHGDSTRVLVRGALLAAMGKPNGTDAARAGLPLGYGLGLQSRERWGLMTQCHVGNIGTFRAILCILRDQQRAFFASYNSDPEDARWDHVDSLLAAALHAEPTQYNPAASVTAPNDAGVTSWNGWYVPRPTRFEQFAYLDALTPFRVAVYGDSLTLIPLGGTARHLERRHGMTWAAPGRAWPTHVLLAVGPDRQLSDGQRTLERVSTARTWWRWISAAVGACCVLLLLLRGVVLTVQRKSMRDPMSWPVVSLLPLALGVAGLLRQPFLAIGDMRWPSVMLAVGSGLLLATTIGAALATGIRVWRFRHTALGAIAPQRGFDGVVIVGAAQWLMTLALWGLLPLRLWA
jgi:CubicO group peptidase (beta-lactamase class C family)